MGNVWKVAREEYNRLARKRSFILSLIGMPIFIGVIVAIAIFTAIPRGDARPLGYVDLAGVMASPVAAGYQASEEIAEPVAFSDEAAGRAALERGEIQGFYLIPADYLQTRRLELYTWGQSPSGRARSAFQDLLTAHVISQAPADAQKILLDGVTLNFRAANDSREMPAEGFFVAIILPFIIGFFFIMVVMSSGGYLLQAVTTEKENRMVEVMMTSVSSLQMIGGKALGLIAVALTQVGVWLLALALALVIIRGQVPWLADIRVPWTTLGVAALLFLPTYVLLAGMMITVGSMVTELQHGQQIAGFFNLLFALPFFFLILVFTNPDSPLMIGLTLFPTTSLMTLTMRWGVTAVPAWQVGLSFVLLVVTALGSIWVAAKVFRIGMLRYGQPLSLAGLREALRPARRAPSAGKVNA
jgi:ABC-2 type transport system permease protein